MNQADFRKMLFAKKDSTGTSTADTAAPAAASAGSGRCVGTVKTYNTAKGFGFIIPGERHPHKLCQHPLAIGSLTMCARVDL